MERKSVRRSFKLLRRHITYRVLLAGAAALGFVPERLLHALGRAGARLAYHVLRRERRRMLRNLRAAFPEETERAREAIARGVFVNVARHAVYVLLSRRRGRVPEGGDLPTREDWDDLRAVLMEKGSIAVTAHVGAWEILGCGTAQDAPEGIGVFAHRLRFAPVNDWIEHMRQVFRVRVFYIDEPLLAAMRYVKRHNIIGILPDQDMKRVPGVFVPFLGRPAWTPIGPAALALAAGVPMFCAYLIWDGGAYRILREGPLPLPATGDRDEDIRILTETWTRILERVIRMYPDQWVWFHRRWRTTPETLERLRAREAKA